MSKLYMKVYLAGPDVFVPYGGEIGHRKREICAAHGLTGLFPLDGDIDVPTSDASMAIFRANTDMMEQADAIIANLTPFRGPSADAGTVYELGYMAGCGKFCAGYSNVPGVYLDRVPGTRDSEQDSIFVDRDELLIEDFNLADNLMIIHALDLNGHPLIAPKQAPADIWRDLTAFEACVRAVAKHARDMQENDKYGKRIYPRGPGSEYVSLKRHGDKFAKRRDKTDE